jgi:hypothetical protein
MVLNFLTFIVSRIRRHFFIHHIRRWCFFGANKEGTYDLILPLFVRVREPQMILFHQTLRWCVLERRRRAHMSVTFFSFRFIYLAA